LAPGGGGALIGGDVLIDPARGEAPVGDLRSLEPDEVARLKGGGLDTIGALAGSEPDRVADLLGVSPIRGFEVIETARTAIRIRPADTPAANRPTRDVRGIGVVFSDRLASGGIHTVGTLALSNPETVARLLEVSEERALELLGRARARVFKQPS
jgi:hypothetical protein